MAVPVDLMVDGGRASIARRGEAHLEQGTLTTDVDAILRRHTTAGNHVLPERTHVASSVLKTKDGRIDEWAPREPACLLGRPSLQMLYK
jgi:hypothetical protein